MVKNNIFECSAVLHGVEIEFTNFCGLDCIGCIRKESKKFGFIDEKILEKIIFFVKKYNYREIVISGLGDTFLHKNLYVFLEKIFIDIPNISVYIMTKGQTIQRTDIDKIFEFKKKGFNLGITFSIFSLKKDEYKEKTGGGKLEHLLEIIQYSFYKKINFSFEFFIDIYNISYIERFKKFTEIFGKDFFYTIPHNWGGNLSEKTYNNLFNEKILENIIIKRGKGELCEAFSGNYIFFDFEGNMYKCGLKRGEDYLFLGNIIEDYDKKLEDLFKRLDYNNCKNCSYYQFKTRLG